MNQKKAKALRRDATSRRAYRESKREQKAGTPSTAKLLAEPHSQRTANAPPRPARMQRCRWLSATSRGASVLRRSARSIRSANAGRASAAPACRTSTCCRTAR